MTALYGRLNLHQTGSNNNPPSEDVCHLIEQSIEEAPLEIRFTIVERFADYEGMVERNPMAGVEIHADNSTTPLNISDYSERSFKKITEKEPWRFNIVGTTDSEGVANVKFNRKNLPKGFIFYDRGNKKASFKYMTLREFMSPSFTTADDAWDLDDQSKEGEESK